ncbi:MAG: hypothetical protein ACPIOQ_63905 [Promethearchaeia archaeon]
MFPDVGASALAMRDWAGEDGHVASSFGRSAPEVDESDDVVVCIAPASSEIEQVGFPFPGFDLSGIACRRHLILTSSMATAPEVGRSHSRAGSAADSHQPLSQVGWR